MSDSNLKTLIVDDSPIYQRIVKRLVTTIKGVELVGICGNGREALDAIEASPPDLVLLDVEMPVMDGLEALAEMRQRFPSVSVLMVSSIADAARTLQALSLGAVDFIPKPEKQGSETLLADLQRGIAVVRAQKRTERLVEQIARRGVAPPDESRRTPTDRRVDEVVAGTLDASQRLIVVGVSTGGPRALDRLIPSLPGDLGAAVLVVQHMPKGFTASLAQTLDRKSLLAVAEAKDGDLVEPGRVFVAPGGQHMELSPSRTARQGVLRLTEGPLRNECRPSVDTLFESVAAGFRGRVLSVVMTGMGRDGCDGVKRLKEKGARCYTQHESTCVVYGMPRAVVEAGLADAQLDLDELGKQVALFAQGGRR